MKEKTSLPSTIFIYGLTGALIGTAIGSPLEDILENTIVNPKLDYLSVYTTIAGAVAAISLGILQHYNKDKTKDRLIIKRTTTEGFVEVATTGIEGAVDKSLNGINNLEVKARALDYVSQIFKNNPFITLQSQYNRAREDILLNFFEVFSPFTYGKTSINPDNSMQSFFEKGNAIYASAREYVIRLTESVTCLRQRPFETREEHNQWAKEFRKHLTAFGNEAQIISLWITYLSHRDGIVGNKVRTTLGEYGITNIDCLSSDIYRVSSNLLQMFDKHTDEQLRLYNS